MTGSWEFIIILSTHYFLNFSSAKSIFINTWLQRPHLPFLDLEGVYLPPVDAREPNTMPGTW